MVEDEEVMGTPAEMSFILCGRGRLNRERTDGSRTKHAISWIRPCGEVI